MKWSVVLSTEILTNLAQLRAMLRKIHTSDEDTIIMANSLLFIDKIIGTVQTEINSKTCEEN